MKHGKNTGKMVMTVLALVGSVALMTYAWDLWVTYNRLKVMTKAWEAGGPYNTVLGHLRRPKAATPDPFEECGIPPASDDWWDFLVRLYKAKGRLTCLQEQMAKAREEHEYLKEMVFGLCSTAFVLIDLFNLWRNTETPDQALEVKEREEEHSVVFPQPQNKGKQSLAGSDETPDSSFDIPEVPDDGDFSLTPVDIYQRDAAYSTTRATSVVPKRWRIPHKPPRKYQQREVVCVPYNATMMLNMLLQVLTLLLLLHLCRR